MCELPTYWTSEKRKARKQHICCECQSLINIGEEYYDERGVWDGNIKNYKTCLSCREVSEKYQEGWDNWECVGLGELYQDLIDSNLLSIVRDEKEEEILTPDGKSYMWVSSVDWLEIENQHPLKLKLSNLELERSKQFAKI